MTTRLIPKSDEAADGDGSGPAGAQEGRGWSGHRLHMVSPREPREALGPTRTTVRLSRVWPWSVFKLALVFSFLAMLAVLAGIGAVYFVLEANGTLSSVEKLVRAAGMKRFQFDAGWIFTRLFWIGTLLAVVASFVWTVVGFLYNALSDLSGGLKLTFDEETVRRRAAARIPRRSQVVWTTSPGPRPRTPGTDNRKVEREIPVDLRKVAGL
jgi:Transmembrane domain of unknown function (DUF3566)